jgi:DNA polymerase I-like protein with 3'-5' exonuclease and polymerase domains
MSGRENFNLASPKQLGDVLFAELKMEPNKKKKTEYATGEVLNYLANKKIKLWDIESNVAKNTRLLLQIRRGPHCSAY